MPLCLEEFYQPRFVLGLHAAEHRHVCHRLELAQLTHLIELEPLEGLAGWEHNAGDGHTVCVERLVGLAREEAGRVRAEVRGEVFVAQANLRCHRLRCCLVVSGHHHHADPGGATGGNGARHLSAWRVHHTYKTKEGEVALVVGRHRGLFGRHGAHRQREHAQRPARKLLQAIVEGVAHCVVHGLCRALAVGERLRAPLQHCLGRALGEEDALPFARRQHAHQLAVAREVQCGDAGELPLPVRGAIRRALLLAELRQRAGHCVEPRQPYLLS
mmetsp:Transcript_20074/g.50010  ORF Transcript_20074/g.50010 Transcript_20074/m.50010 type:complete len:272 (-) Transcript_20074:1447-2262(-)